MVVFFCVPYNHSLQHKDTIRLVYYSHLSIVYKRKYYKENTDVDSRQKIYHISSIIMPERQPLIDLFLQINSQINLSAIRDPEGVYHKHILDSLELTKIINLSDYDTLCDVGTGGGFPLLALSQYNMTHHCGLSLTGIDARRKKIDAITSMIQTLWLPDTKAVWTRAEEHTTQYDVVTARAVAYADKIIPRCLPLCKRWGIICLYKEYKEEEYHEIISQCKKHWLTLLHKHQYILEYERDHNQAIQRILYVLQKTLPSDRVSS